MYELIGMEDDTLPNPTDTTVEVFPLTALHEPYAAFRCSRSPSERD